MGVTLRQLLPSAYKYSLKCPNKMTARYITVHNTYNDASAENEIKYMINNDKEVSFHIAVDDKEAVQGIPLDRNAWHAGDGNGTGNRESIGIEICYSRSGGERFQKAEKNAAVLIAQMLKERGWGLDRVKKHQDWSGKNCPHRTIELGWQRFLDMIKAEMDQYKPANPERKTVEQLAREVIDGKWGVNPERKQRLKAQGYNYEAVQTRVNEILRGKPVQKPTPPKTQCYPGYAGHSIYVDEVLKAIGVPEQYRGSYKKRKPLAAKNGIANYTGTAAQNNNLISLAKQGRLKRV